MMTTLGGVGRNIAESIQCLRESCLLITAVGNDQPGQMIISAAIATADQNNNRVCYLFQCFF
ncbi:hypothetical protein BLA29_014986 [Euroglyphus maynei]|uniref:Carbohydrate kinase PfkB domain-containing protein n=1 Tax=Euroglyphus maynei TaxID=6958 RepID=A0A1Y3ARH6_EURMA|nr:hypothetical protein BLA29_014986 [Euroglyphus maynei]